jgi:proteasome lid subunit RPN8/RPN11
MALRLRRDHMERMLAHAHAEAPNECCGVLLGNGEAVEEVFVGRNVHETPRTRYLMDPQDLLRMTKRQDELGWDVVGIYHSHPQTKPEPSETDKALALYPDARYVIVSLRDPGHPEVRAWRILDRPSAERPMRDRSGSTVRDVVEEDVVVT